MTKPGCSSVTLHLHEVDAVGSLEERLHRAQELLRLQAPLVELQDLLRVLPRVHGERALQHLHGLGLVGLQQRMHPLVLGYHTLLQLRHGVLPGEDTQSPI